MVFYQEKLLKNKICLCVCKMDFNSIFASSIASIAITGCSVARSSRLVWDQEVAGSNPATPTKSRTEMFGFFICLNTAKAIFASLLKFK
jgi:hypothetical protein